MLISTQLDTFDPTRFPMPTQCAPDFPKYRNEFNPVCIEESEGLYDVVASIETPRAGEVIIEGFPNRDSARRWIAQRGLDLVSPVTKQPALEQHSTTGVRYDGAVETTYDHIHVQPTTDTISGCNACGRPNYVRENREAVDPNGLQLFDLEITSNGQQIAVTRLCPECIKDLRAKLYPFSA